MFSKSTITNDRKEDLMTKRQKKALLRILLGIVAFIIAKVLPFKGIYQLAPFLIAYLIVGGDVLFKALRNIGRGHIFDENFLMAIATVGAFFVGQYPEGVAVMLFYQIGELFQNIAVNKSRKSISALMDIRPDYANIERDNTLVQVSPEEVCIDDIIIVKPGEKVPLDGIVIEGNSSLDTRALTGESLPREITLGDNILSGCININGVLKVKVTKEFGNSTVAKILDLVENASSKKSHSENFITKFAKYYTPCVVIAATILAILPPLFLPNATFSEWIHRALIFLVISCPCALVISVPLSFFGGIGGASKVGILVKGSNYLESLASSEIVVFDKTGTLTKGNFKVTKVEPVQMEADDLLKYAAYAESYSTHPISLSLQEAYGQSIEKDKVLDVEEISGHGVKASFEDNEILAGNIKLMQKYLIEGISSLPNEIGTVVHVAINQTYAGYILISDEIKKDAKEAIQNLKDSHVKKTIMLTGDQEIVAKEVANQLGLDEYRSELLPVDKVDALEALLEKRSSKGKLIFVGDGINDAPVLSRADIGIAMGAIGSDAAIEAADIVLMTDEPSKISVAIQIARKTLTIVKQNIYFALGVKGIVLILGAIGIATMWSAVFADVGVSVIAILNAMRALHVKGMKK